MIIAIVRVILVSFLSICICIFGIICCLLNYRQRVYYTAVCGRLFGCMAPIFGIRVEVRNLLYNNFPKSCIYIANHQNNYDMVTVSYVIQPNTILVGKKKLLWIPLFGQLLWLSGNILIDHQSYTIKRIKNVLIKIIKTIKINNISVWFFPEGTRNYGKDILLPFKTGAFYIAVSSKIPIVPICVSNISNKKIKLNRWSNGLVIIEIMPPIETYSYKLNQVRNISVYCHKIMKLKIESLNKEVDLREI